MIHTLSNIFVVLWIAMAAATGARHGLYMAGGHLLALMVGVAAAALAYVPVGRLIMHSINGATLPLVSIGAYLAVLVFAMFSVLLILARFARPRPRRAGLTGISRFGGLVISTVEGVLLAAIVVSLGSSLPLSSDQKEEVTEAAAAQPLVHLGNTLQSLSAPAHAIQTVSLLTVAPNDQTSVALGFTSTSAAEDTVAEDKLLTLVNEARVNRGVSALKVNPALRIVALQHSQDMMARGYLSHLTLEHAALSDRLKPPGIAASKSIENIALAPVVELAHSGLMNTPATRENLLDPELRQVGLGVVSDPAHGAMVTQDFTN